MESLRQYAVDRVSKISDTAGKMMAAPLRSDNIRCFLKSAIKGGIFVGRMTLDALDNPRKELGDIVEEARRETKSTSPAKGKKIPIKEPGKTDLTKLSIEELYELAQRHDISGRSEMNKQELINAIRTKHSKS
jgi:hypothetical protein